MSGWTITPDGLKTDEQLWADDFLTTTGTYCPICGNNGLEGAGINETCKRDPCAGELNAPAAIRCHFCWCNWCKKCLGEA